jgi:hypothetical protein
MVFAPMPSSRSKGYEMYETKGTHAEMVASLLGPSRDPDGRVVCVVQYNDRSASTLRNKDVGERSDKHAFINDGTTITCYDGKLSFPTFDPHGGVLTCFAGQLPDLPLTKSVRSSFFPERRPSSSREIIATAACNAYNLDTSSDHCHNLTSLCDSDYSLLFGELVESQDLVTPPQCSCHRGQCSPTSETNHIL